MKRSYTHFNEGTDQWSTEWNNILELILKVNVENSYGSSPEKVSKQFCFNRCYLKIDEFEILFIYLKSLMERQDIIILKTSPSRF